VEAVRKLCDRAGVRFPERRLTPEQAEAARKNEARRSVLDAVMEYARACLWSTGGEKARAYLHERGFTDEDIRSLGLGLYGSVSAAREAILKAGHGEREAEDAAVLWVDLQGYILIPWADDYGRPLTIYGRWKEKTPPEGKTKTIALPGEGTKRSPLYFDRARAAGHKDLVLVEGVFDAALLQVKGDSRAVASVAAQLNQNQVETLRRHHIRSVYICGDPDGGGDRGTLANVAALEKAGIKAYVVPRLPDGMDPDEYVQAHGIDAWKALVSRSEHAYGFRAREIVERHKATGEGENVWTDRAFEEALAYDERTTDPRARVDLDRYFWPVMRTSLDLPEETVRECLEERRRQADRNKEQKALEEQARATTRLVEELQRDLDEVGPEAALRRFYDEVDHLRREALSLKKAEEAVCVAEELHAHEERLAKWRGLEYIGLPQKTIEALDQATLGLRGLMVMAAAPNVGKTALAVQLGTDVVVHNEDACFVFLSLEMSRWDILTRIKCRLAEMDWKTLVFGSSKKDPGFYRLEQLESLRKAERKLLEIGDRILILDERNFPDPTVEKLVREVEAMKARTGTTRAFVLVDYLQVLPIPEQEARDIRTELDADKWRIGAMRDLRDYLGGDAVMVISEARKPSGAAGERWGGALADIMGAARGAYTPDIVFLFLPLGDEEIAKKFGLSKTNPKGGGEKLDLEKAKEKREALQECGISLNNLIIAKGRDGVTKRVIPITFWLWRSSFTEGHQDENGRALE
jgi:DNA primase